MKRNISDMVAAVSLFKSYEKLLNNAKGKLQVIRFDHSGRIDFEDESDLFKEEIQKLLKQFAQRRLDELKAIIEGGVE